MFITDCGISICFNDMHPEKAKIFIDFIDGGRTTSVKDVQLLKNLSEIDIIEDGISIFFNDEQPSNIFHWAEVTEVGIVMSVNDIQPLNI